MKKLTWETPELVILAKGKPEESVLRACKMIEGFFSDYDPDTRKCIKYYSGAWVDCMERAVT